MKNVLAGGTWAVLLMVVASSAWAADAPASKLDKQIAAQTAQNQKLQESVDKQESRQHDEDAKLKQQDATIADLQTQLKSLQPAPSVGGSQH